MTDRLTDRLVDLYARPEGGSAWIDGVLVITSGDNTALVRAAQEVQASRKLIADLLALLTSAANPSLTFTQRDDLLAIVRLAGKHPDVSDFHEAIAATQPDTNEGD